MSGAGDQGPGELSRRGALATAASIVGSSVAGCVATGGETVSVLAAGSLARTFEDHVSPAFREETGIEVRGEYYGTNAVMRMVEDRTKLPDVIVSADSALLRDRLYPEFTGWDVEFATNSLGIGYNGATPFGEDLDAGRAWYEAALATEAGALSISDPDLDPLGYRALQAFELAGREHGLDGFRSDMRGKVIEQPEEPKLMAGVETGTRAGAVVYRNMAADHDAAFLEFPAAYNFANPELADQYATVSYTTDEGYTVEGRPVLYNATVHAEADQPAAGQRLIQFLVDEPAILEAAGLTVGDAVPRPNGAVPEAVAV